MKINLILILLFFATFANAQPYSAYTDVRQNFYAFDNGEKVQLDHLVPISYKIGKSALAYVDNARDFRVFQDGVVIKVSDLFTTQFEVTDNLVLFRSANLLNVIEGNKIHELSFLTDRFVFGDSVVLFYDLNKASFNAYYNGEIKTLENFLTINDEDFQFGTTVKASDNIGAYVSFDNQFKVFYLNTITSLETQIPLDFQVGRNTCAYIDINNQFKIFHKGQTYTIDYFKPTSYQVGDDIVAFQGNDGNFKIFYDGQLHTIGYYSPKYQIYDNVVAYEDLNRFFSVFYKGESTQLDNFYPNDILSSYHSLVYTNRSNMIRMFSYGKVNDVTNMSVKESRLDYDVLQYKVGFNSFKFFTGGKNFE